MSVKDIHQLFYKDKDLYFDWYHFCLEKLMTTGIKIEKVNFFQIEKFVISDEVFNPYEIKHNKKISLFFCDQDMINNLSKMEPMWFRGSFPNVIIFSNDKFEIFDQGNDLIIKLLEKSKERIDMEDKLLNIDSTRHYLINFINQKITESNIFNLLGHLEIDYDYRLDAQQLIDYVHEQSPSFWDHVKDTQALYDLCRIFKVKSYNEYFFIAVFNEDKKVLQEIMQKKMI